MLLVTCVHEDVVWSKPFWRSLGGRIALFLFGVLSSVAVERHSAEQLFSEYLTKAAQELGRASANAEWSSAAGDLASVYCLWRDKTNEAREFIRKVLSEAANSEASSVRWNLTSLVPHALAVQSPDLAEEILAVAANGPPKIAHAPLAEYYLEHGNIEAFDLHYRVMTADGMTSDSTYGLYSFARLAQLAAEQGKPDLAHNLFMDGVALAKQRGRNGRVYAKNVMDLCWLAERQKRAGFSEDARSTMGEALAAFSQSKAAEFLLHELYKS